MISLEYDPCLPQVCDQLVKAGQWPTALDLLRRTAAVLPGVPIATRLLGLQLMRAAVRSGAGDAALHACVDVAPLQQEMLLVLLQHHRTARNLAVRIEIPGTVQFPTP